MTTAGIYKVGPSKKYRYKGKLAVSKYSGIHMSLSRKLEKM
jgi:hypothetical protein